MTRIFSGEAVGPEQKYRGRTIQAWFYGPDCLCLVDGEQVGHYYPTAEDARKAGMRYVDQVEKERAQA